MIEQKKKYEEAIERLKKIPVDNTKEPITLPQTLSNVLYLENPPEIQMNRYYVTNSAQEIFKKIDTLNAVSTEMKEKKIKFMNSALIYGDSGTGKTQFARYVATQLDLPFIYINISTIRDSFMGATSKTLSLIFKYIKDTSCLFMMDELDTIASRRGSESGWSTSGESDRIVTSIIQLLDGLGNNVIVMGATNRMDIIDDAVLRRFRIKEEFVKLSGEEAFKMAEKYLTDCDIKFKKEELNVFLPKDWNPSKVENILIDSIAEHLINGTSFKLIVGENIYG